MLHFVALSALFLRLASLGSGTYDVYWYGVRHGTAQYEIDDDTVRMENRLEFSASSKMTVLLGNGRPVYARFEIKGAVPSTSEIQIADDIRKKTPGGFQPIKDSQGMLPYYTSQPFLAKYLLDEYGSKPDGFRKIGALDISKLTPRSVSASLDRVETRAIAGKDEGIRVWRIESAPNPESVVYTDEANRPLEWWIPSLNFEMVLRGYESLRPSAPWEGNVSPPKYEVEAAKGRWTTLRNGLRLKADVYRPRAAGKFPVILQRTCYDRTEFGTADGEYFASRGYIYVTQNVRGRGGSEGPFEPEEHEAEDGYDSVKWCGTQSWSNGKVGMIGASYNGFCGWTAATTHPQWLKTLVSVVPMPGSPDGAPWDGGTQYVGANLSWFGLLRDPMKVQTFSGDLTKATNTLPMSDSDLVAFGHHVPAYQTRIKPNSFDPFVRKTSYRYDLGTVNIPVMHMDGWFDTVAVGTRLNYNMMVASGSKDQKLVWGPWNHFTNRESLVGDNDPGPQGYVPMQVIILRWFDRWLKGRQNGIEKEPHVDEFVLGANRWVKSNQWPPKAMRPQKWYLRQGKALTEASPKLEPASKFIYDPSKWVADDHLQSSFFFLLGSDAGSLCLRPDVLVYESKPLSKTIRLDGPIRGHLFASTSAKDTDWAMALLDVHPDGKAVSLSTGLVRARYRKSYVHPQLLKPHELVAYDIDMWQSGMQIPPGHKLRVVVLSTLFPDRDRNLNTGEPIYNATQMVVAKQTVYHDKSHPSYVELPIVPPISG